MKQTLFTLSGLIMLLIMTACGQSDKDANTTANDSLSVSKTTELHADEAQSATVETIAIDPEETLVLTVTNKNLKYEDEASNMTGYWTVKVENKSNATIKGDLYTVSYQETIEENAGAEGFIDVIKTRTLPGKDIGAGESITMKLQATEGCQGFSSPKISSTK